MWVILVAHNSAKGLHLSAFISLLLALTPGCGGKALLELSCISEH